MGHIPGATSMPLAELRARMFELPPPYEEPVTPQPARSPVKRIPNVCGAQRHLLPASERCCSSRLAGDLTAWGRVCAP